MIYDLRFKTILLLTFIFTLLTFNVPKVHAHILKSSGSVGAVMHITPDDDPIAKQQSDLFFEFKDKQNKFKPDNCNCTITIFQAGKEIYSASLFQNYSNPNSDTISLSFTFPQKDVYTIKIIGKPLAQNAFEEFLLEYDIRVARESFAAGLDSTNATTKDTSWIATHIPHLIGTSIIVLFVIFAFIKKFAIKSKKTKV